MTGGFHAEEPPVRALEACNRIGGDTNAVRQPTFKPAFVHVAIGIGHNAAAVANALAPKPGVTL